MPRSAEAARRLRTIHAAAREIGLDDDARRDMQVEVTGKASTADMSPAELQKVIDRLKERGWSPKARTSRKGWGWGPRELRSDQRYALVLWGRLCDAKVEGPYRRDKAAVNAFISSTKFAAKWGHLATDLAFIDQDRCADVIEALKVVCVRNGLKV